VLDEGPVPFTEKDTSGLLICSFQFGSAFQPRSAIPTVAEFFVTNRCAEKSYPPSFFHGRVTRYRIDDFNPPPIEMIREFCEDVDRWLSLDQRNVVAVHCQAGKV